MPLMASVYGCISAGVCGSAAEIAGANATPNRYNTTDKRFIVWAFSLIVTWLSGSGMCRRLIELCFVLTGFNLLAADGDSTAASVKRQYTERHMGVDVILTLYGGSEPAANDAAAKAQVEQLKNQAEADGKRMMVQAFGTGNAYNLYTFAESFAPESIRLIFAGEGTFWTDLTKLQDAAAMELLRKKPDQK